MLYNRHKKSVVKNYTVVAKSFLLSLYPLRRNAFSFVQFDYSKRKKIPSYSKLTTKYSIFGHKALCCFPQKKSPVSRTLFCYGVIWLFRRDQALNALNCPPLGLIGHARVKLHRGACVLMPKQLLHLLEISAAFQRQRCGCVPKIVR